MANADARLNLIVTATDAASPIFAAIAAEASRVGLSIGSAFGQPMNTNVSTLSQSLSMAQTNMASLSGASVNANGQLNFINGNIGQLVMKLPQANDHLKTMQSMMAFESLKQASDAMKEFGQTILDQLGAGIDQAMQFEEHMVDIKHALMINKDVSVDWNNVSKSGEQLNGVLDEVGAKALDVALKTKFNDNEILALMAYLTQNGISSKDVIGGVAESVAYLAQATNSDWKPAAQTFTSVVHAMGNTLKNEFHGDMKAAMASVADTMTNINQTTGQSLTTMANTFKYVLPIADEFGWKFKDIGTAVDSLYRVGIQGSQAGTALRTMLSSLTGRSQEAKDLINQLSSAMGYSSNMFVDASGNVKSFAEVQELLNASIGKLPAVQRAAAINTIFGRYAMAGMMQVVSMAPSEFQSLADKVGQTGTAFAKSADWASTAAGKYDIFKENVTAIKRQLGTQLLDAIKPLLDMLNSLAEKFSNLSPHAQKVIAMTAAIIGIFAIVVGTVGGAIASFGLFSAGLAAVGITMGALLSTIGIVIGVIAAIGLAVYGLYKAWTTNFGGIRDFTMPILDTIRAAFSQAFEAIKAVVGPALQAVGDFLRQFVKDAEEVTKGVLDGIAKFAPLWRQAWEAIKDVVETTWNLIVGVVRGAWDVLMGVYDFFVGLLTGNWKRMFDGIGETAEGALKIIGAIVKFGLNAVWTVFEGVLTSLVGLFDSIFHTDIATKVREGLDWVKTKAGESFQKIADAMWTWGRNAVKMIADGIESAIQWVEDSVTKVANKIKSYLGFHSPTEAGPLSDSDSYMPNMMSMFADGIAKNIPALTDASTKAASALAAPFQDVNLDWSPKVAASVNDAATELLRLDNEYKPKLAALKDRIFNDNSLDNAGRVKLMGELKALQSEFDAKRQAAANSWKATSTTVAGANQSIASSTASTWSSAASTTAIGSNRIAQSIDAFATQVRGQLTNVSNEVSVAWTAMWTMLTNTTVQSLEKIAVAVKGGLTKILETFTTAGNDLKTFFTALATNMFTFGRDAMQALADGLRSRIAAVQSAVAQAAQVMQSYLALNSTAAQNGLPPILPSIVGQSMNVNVTGGIGRGSYGGGNRSVAINYYGTGTRKDDDYLADQVRRVLAMP